MNNKFKIDDRVARYSEERTTGRIIEVCEDSVLVALDKKYQDATSQWTEWVHHKQCRRLVKKERRRIWVKKEPIKNEILIVLQNPPTGGLNGEFSPDKWIEFIEVKKE